MRCGTFLAGLLGILLIGTGCASSSDSTIEFRSDRSGQIYTQQFTKAQFSRISGGEYNVVLTDGVTATDSKPTGPLASAATDPLTQTVYIRVLWKPMTGIKPDAPSATNAVIDWRVKSNDPAQADYLHYRGAGFVAVYDSGETTRFVIRGARVELTSSNGRLQDPLGSSSISGSFIATRNDGQVASAMGVLREEVSRRTAQSAGYIGAPPRTPAGP